MPAPTAMAYLEKLRTLERKLPPLNAMDMSRLPSTVQQLTRLLGVPAALSLVEKLGGVTLRIPLGSNAQGRALLDELAKIVGEKGAQALAREYAATQLYIPSCKQALVHARNKALVQDRDRLAASGLSERDIVLCLSLRYNISDRYIWQILKMPMDAIPTGPRQASLL